jgi:hypothetical protein
LSLAGKDVAWSYGLDGWKQARIMWIIFVIPTFLIAFHFVYTTAVYKYMLVNHVHYVAQLLWVGAVSRA